MTLFPYLAVLFVLSFVVAVVVGRRLAKVSAWYLEPESAGGIERLPIEVQPLSPPSDGQPSAAFMAIYQDEGSAS